jgi:crossover junction endodeoxyribonuclease RuvC
MITFILGIDPGHQGAFALYNPDTQVPSIHDMPITDAGVNPSGVAAYIESVIAGTDGHKVIAVVEDVHGMPRQAGVFAFGFGTGILYGVLAAYGIPTIAVSPAKWKVAMGLRRHVDETKEENKTRARMVVSALFPHLKDQFRLKKHDGRAEALLIALYYNHIGRHEGRLA